jgi:putative drug exporter of the RND superfamily
VSFIKVFGIGLAIAVLMDAFVIEATLVPVFMRIAGEANWRAPRWMRRIHDGIGISETEEPEPHPRRPARDGSPSRSGRGEPRRASVARARPRPSAG